MTQYELERGNELADKMEMISMSIDHLERALNHNERRTKKFFLESIGKGKGIKIVGDSVAFGGYLPADRELLELILNHYKNKLAEANDEFERLGKGGAE